MRPNKKTIMAVALIICIAFMLPFVGRSALRFLKKYMELSYNSKLESENEKIKNFEETPSRR